MAKRSSQQRAARKRAERKKRRHSSGGEESSGGGGLMMGMRGGFASAVHGKKKSRGRRALGWLPILLVVVALVILAQRLGLF